VPGGGVASEGRQPMTDNPNHSQREVSSGVPDGTPEGRRRAEKAPGADRAFPGSSPGVPDTRATTTCPYDVTLRSPNHAQTLDGYGPYEVTLSPPAPMAGATSRCVSFSSTMAQYTPPRAPGGRGGPPAVGGRRPAVGRRQAARRARTSLNGDLGYAPIPAFPKEPHCL
jgi:hypothetical protein